VIRKAAVWFAVLSGIYWATVHAFWEGVRSFGLTPFGLPSSWWSDWLIGIVPLLLYSVFCVFYFHRFARRVFELAKSRPEA
jgi:hypothetical protein